MNEKEQSSAFEKPAKLQRIQAVELDLLHKFQTICEKHSIHYIVYAGTMLGAIRHKGFIPWDDDLDVALTRTEFERLCRVAPAECKHPYFFQTAYTDKKYHFGYARLRNSDTTGAIVFTPGADYNNGIYIDIYVLDYLPDGLLNELVFRFKRRLLQSMLNDQLQGIKKAVSTLLRSSIYHAYSEEQIRKKYDEHLSNTVNSSGFLTLATHSKWVYMRYRIKASDLESITMIPFEDTFVPVPQNYSEYLTSCYGDFMTPPSNDEMGKWHEGIVLFNPDIPYSEFFTEDSQRMQL